MFSNSPFGTTCYLRRPVLSKNVPVIDLLQPNKGSFTELWLTAKVLVDLTDLAFKN